MDIDEHDLLDVLFDGGPTPQRMIVVKTVGDSLITGEDNDGQMVVIDLEEMTVKTLLDGDRNWVQGELSSKNSAWEIIGFHLGLCDGNVMDRSRSVTN